MKLIYAFLLVFGIKRQDSIESITKPMKAIVERLEQYAVEQTELANADAERAAELKAKADQENACACDARALADRYSKLTV